MNTGNNKFLSVSEKAVVIVFLYLCIQCSILGGNDPEKWRYQAIFDATYIYVISDSMPNSWTILKNIRCLLLNYNNNPRYTLHHNQVAYFASIVFVNQI